MQLNVDRATVDFVRTKCTKVPKSSGNSANAPENRMQPCFPLTPPSAGGSRATVISQPSIEILKCTVANRVSDRIRIRFGATEPQVHTGAPGAHAVDPQGWPVQPPRRPGMPAVLPHVQARDGAFLCQCGACAPAGPPCPWEWLEMHRECGGL